jgi:glutamate--cysteine ligase
MRVALGPPLSEQAAEEYLARNAFHTCSPQLVGARLEWLVRHAENPVRPVAAALVEAALSGGQHSLTPGGGIRVSTPPYRSLNDLVHHTASDLSGVRGALAAAGLATMNSALDPFRSPRAAVRSPRHAATERYFNLAGTGDSGRWTIYATASLSVRLDAGHAQPGPLGFRRRWALAHAVGPVLVAAFANSPLLAAAPTGWRSTRQALLLQLDPGRTAPPAPGDPRESWSRYVLDASVAYIRERRTPWTAPAGLTFREWIRSGAPRPPTLDDLDEHLGTLYPPVRPNGQLELRMVDAQPGDGWVVPVAVIAGLFADAKAGDAALAATERLHARRRPYRSGPWARAARHGLRDPELAAAALECFHTSYEVLARTGTSPAIRQAVAEFIEAYVARGRCPADDVLDTLQVQPNGAS